MLAKTCLACGYRGPALQGPARAIRCPGCGADLYARPPRSYAELEGFLPSEETVDLHTSEAADRPEGTRLRRARSLALRVLVMALIITPPLVVVAAAGALAAIWMLRG